MNSWGTYLTASVALVLILTQPLSSTTKSAREASDWRILDGMRKAVNALSPGEQLDLAYGSNTVGDEIRFGGHQFWCNYGGGTLTLPSVWQLPNITLSPMVHYRISLTGDQVQVVRIG